MSSIPRFSTLQVTRPNLENLKTESSELLRRWDSSSTDTERVSLIEAWQEARAGVQTQASIAYARFAQDTLDTQSKEDNAFFDDLSPDLQELNQAMIQRLVDPQHREALEARYGRHVFDSWELELTTFDPVIADDRREIAKKSNRYKELMASVRVQFEGKEWTLSTIRARTGDADRAVREGSARAIHDALLGHVEELDSLYDELTTIRCRVAEKLGHGEFTPLGYAQMGRTDYGPADVEIFRSQVRDCLVPLCSRIWKRRGQSLGVDRVEYWDETVRDSRGEPCPEGDRAWMVQRATELFDRMGGEFGDFFRMLRDHELMDLDSREGKQGGGFCMDLAAMKVPFIFANFAGTQADVKVFTHECGHAYQNWQASKIQPLLEYRWPTSEAAEIHSMSLEFLTHPHMELFFGDDASRFREGHLEGALLFIPYGCAIDHFQHMVYANPSASSADRAEMWKECERLYLPHRQYSDLPLYSGGRIWQRQRHVYCYPFYYIDYCLAQTVALQLWHGALDDRPGTMARYEQLCQLGGSQPFTKLLDKVGLDSPLREGSLSAVVQTSAEALGLD